MLIPCSLAQARFPGEGLRLHNSEPARMLWDCHHGDTFVLKVGHLTVETIPEDSAAPVIRLELSLSPPEKQIPEIEGFAAIMGLAPKALSSLPEELLLRLTLAAAHIPGAQLFIFSEEAELLARRGTPGTWELQVTGPFRSRRIPCQEADILIHLDRPATNHLLSYFFTLVRGRIGSVGRGG